jgi:hypothetical protein
MNTITPRQRQVAERVRNNLMKIWAEFTSIEIHLSNRPDTDQSVKDILKAFEGPEMLYKDLDEYQAGNESSLTNYFKTRLLREVTNMIEVVGEYDSEFIEKANAFIKNPVGGIKALEKYNMIYNKKSYE